MAQLSKMLAEMIEKSSFNESFKNRLRDIHVYNYKTYRDVRVEDKNEKNKVMPKNFLSDSAACFNGIFAVHKVQSEDEILPDLRHDCGVESKGLRSMFCEEESNPMFALYNYCFQNADFAAWYVCIILMMCDKVRIHTQELTEYVKASITGGGFQLLGSRAKRKMLIDDVIEYITERGSADIKTTLMLMHSKGLKLDEDLNICNTEKSPSQRDINKILFECGFVRFNDNGKKFEKLQLTGLIMKTPGKRNSPWQRGADSLQELFDKVTEGYGIQEKESFIRRFIEMTELFSGIYPMGEIGSYLMRRLGRESISIVRSKNMFAKRTLNDCNIIDILSAMERSKWLYITYRNATDQRYQSILAYPLEIRESTRDGRQYMVFYNPNKRSVSGLSIEFIDRIEEGDYSEENSENDIKRARRACMAAWGSRFPNFMDGNVMNDVKTHSVRIVVDKSDRNTYERFASWCGEVTEQGDNIEYNVDAISSDEMIPWLHRILPEIRAYDVDGKTHLRSLRREAMRCMNLYSGRDAQDGHTLSDRPCILRLHIETGSEAEKHFAVSNRWRKEENTNTVFFERRGGENVVKREVTDFLDIHGAGGIIVVEEKTDNISHKMSVDIFRAEEADRYGDFLYVTAAIWARRYSRADIAFSDEETLIKMDDAQNDYVQYSGIIPYQKLVVRIMRNKSGLEKLVINGREKNVDLTDKNSFVANQVIEDVKPEGFIPCKAHELLFNEIYGTGYYCMGELAYEVLHDGDISTKLVTTEADIDAIMGEGAGIMTVQDNTDYRIMCRATDILVACGVDTTSPRARQTLARTLYDMSCFVKAVGNYKTDKQRFEPLISIDGSVSSFEELVPVSLIEKQWLSDVLTDERARVFLTDDEIGILQSEIELKERIFCASGINYYDRYRYERGDREIAVLREILQSANEQRCIKLTVDNGDEEKEYNVAVCNIEYDNELDEFILCGVVPGVASEQTAGNDITAMRVSATKWLNEAFVRISARDILGVYESDDMFDRDGFNRLIKLYREQARSVLTLKFKDTRNVPDRILNEFSMYRTVCRREGNGVSGVYTMIVYYDKEDICNIASTVFSYGAYVYVESDTGEVKAKVLEMLERVADGYKHRDAKDEQLTV